MMRISLINQNSKIVFDGDSVTLWDILELLTKDPHGEKSMVK